MDAFITFLYLAIFARVILSWVSPMGMTNNVLINLIYQITEPILAPVRSVIPRVGFFDFSPMIVLIVLGLLQKLIHSL